MRLANSAPEAIASDGKSGSIALTPAPQRHRIAGEVPDEFGVLDRREDAVGRYRI